MITCTHIGYLLSGPRTAARPGLVEVTGGMALISAELDLVRRYGATHTSQQLADKLNAAGLTTGKGKRFTTAGVARVRDA